MRAPFLTQAAAVFRAVTALAVFTGSSLWQAAAEGRAASFRAGARPLPADFTLEIPMAANRALPAWLGQPELRREESLSSLAVSLAPLGGRAADLAVTVVFLDLETAFLRVIWDGPGGAVTLARNLGEGTGTMHQRTLIIPGPLLEEGGALLISAPGEAAPVKAVRFAWLQRREVSATSGTPETALLDGGRLVSAAEVSGLPVPPEEDEWKGWILTAPLIERMEALEDGVAFAAELARVPEQALLRGRLAGVRPGTEVRVSLNGKDAGPLPLSLPPLDDPGYGKDSAGRWYFAGWRDFAAALPVELLRPGENTVQLWWPRTAQGTEPVSAGSLALELRYEPAPDAESAPKGPPSESAPEEGPEPQDFAN